MSDSANTIDPATAAAINKAVNGAVASWLRRPAARDFVRDVVEEVLAERDVVDAGKDAE